MISETFERTPAAVCECDLVWRTAVDNEVTDK